MPPASQLATGTNNSTAVPAGAVLVSLLLVTVFRHRVRQQHPASKTGYTVWPSSHSDPLGHFVHYLLPLFVHFSSNFASIPSFSEPALICSSFSIFHLLLASAAFTGFGHNKLAAHQQRRKQARPEFCDHFHANQTTNCQ